MKVYIKNKFLSIAGNSSVVDESGTSVYDVKGKVVSPTAKKYVCDKDGNHLYMVRNKFFHFITEKALIYDAEGKQFAKVKSKVFHPNKYDIKMADGSEMKIDGKFFALTCRILRNGEVVGTIRRQINFFVDSFELEGEEKDMPFLIALVIAVDNIVDQKRREANRN